MKNVHSTSVALIAEQTPRTASSHWKATLTFSALLMLMPSISAMSEDKKVEEAVKRMEGVIA